MSYVEVHCHSAYSFLDGVYGSLEFAHAVKALGVLAITGAEVTLDGGAHVTLLVESRCGYRNLCRLLTAAHAGTRGKETVGARYISPLPPSVPLEMVIELSEGLVCL